MIKKILIIIGAIIAVIILLPFLPTQFGLNFIGASTINCHTKTVDSIQCSYSSQGLDSPGWTYLANSGQNQIDMKDAGICAGHVSTIRYRHSSGEIRSIDAWTLLEARFFRSICSADSGCTVGDIKNCAIGNECAWRENDNWLKSHDAYSLTPGLSLAGLKQYVALDAPPIEDCYDFWIDEHQGFGEATITSVPSEKRATSCKMEQTSRGKVNIFFQSPCVDKDCSFNMTCKFEQKAQICVPEQKRCTENNIEKCSPNGLEWQIIEQCSEACFAGECKVTEEALEDETLCRNSDGEWINDECICPNDSIWTEGFGCNPKLSIDEGIIDTIEEIFTPEGEVEDEELPIEEELSTISDFCGDGELDWRVENCNTCPQDCGFWDKVRQFFVDLKTIFRGNR